MIANGVVSSMSPLSNMVPVKLANVGTVPVNQIPVISPRINLFDPRGSKVIALGPQEDEYITSNFTFDGTNVTISGKRCDVRKVIGVLRNNESDLLSSKSFFEPEPEKPKKKFFEPEPVKPTKPKKKHSDSGFISVDDWINGKR